MNNKPIFTQQARFQYLSKLAASQERQGNYAEASQMWSKAAKDASNAANQAWCINRADFCDRVAERPFSKE